MGGGGGGVLVFFFFNDTATTEIYTLSLHDALPICLQGGFGSAVMESLMDAGVCVPVKRIGVPDKLVDHATPAESKAALGLTSPQIADQVREMFQPSVVAPTEQPATV